MSMFNDIERTKKGDTEICLHNAKRSGSICDPVQDRTLVLLGGRVRNYVVEQKFQRTSEKKRCCCMSDD